MLSYERLKQARRKTIGMKQTSKALSRGLAKVVYIARDAEERVTADLVSKCKQTNVPITYVDCMMELGEACGIEVGAAACAVVED